MLDIYLISQAVNLIFKGIDNSKKVLDWTESLRVDSKFKKEIKTIVNNIQLEYTPGGCKKNWLWNAVSSASKRQNRMKSPTNINEFASNIVAEYDLRGVCPSLSDDQVFNIAYQVAYSLVELVDPNYLRTPAPGDFDWMGYLQRISNFLLPQVYEEDYIPLKCGKDYFLRGKKYKNNDKRSYKLDIAKEIDLEKFLLNDWLNSNDQVLTLLGDFGSGKTRTLLRFSRALIQRGYSPIFLPLRRLVPAIGKDNIINSIRLYLEEWSLMPQSKFPLYVQEEWTKNNTVVFIFDGFDEYASKIISQPINNNLDREQLGYHLETLLDLNKGGCRVILSSRPPVFKSHGELDRFLRKKFEDIGSRETECILTDGFINSNEQAKQYLNVRYIYPFSESQARMFLDKRKESKLNSYIWGNDSIYNLKDLARTPILLDLICRHLPVLKERSHNDSIHTIDLYAQALVDWENTLYERANSSLYPKLGTSAFVKRVTQVAASVARRMLIEGKDNVPFSEIHSPNWKDGDEVLRQVLSIEYCMSGMMIWDVDDHLRFIHRSFMEFLQAIVICWDIEKGDAELLTKIGAKIDEAVLFFLFEWTNKDRRRLEKVQLQLAEWLDGFKSKTRVCLEEQELIQFILNCKSYFQEQRVLYKSDDSINDFWQTYTDNEIKEAAGLAEIETVTLPNNSKYKIQFQMARVQKGTVLSGRKIHTREHPVHMIVVEHSFLIGVTTVTQDMYQAVMGNNPSQIKGARYPVAGVSWLDAVEFCNRLSTKLNVAPAYEINDKEVNWNKESNGYRLPLESEWEYACRAGTTTEFARGDIVVDLDKMGWFDENSEGIAHSVGEKNPNAWGIYDMHGNVWEWCWDAKEASRVIRGGSWSSLAQYCRSSSRGFSFPASNDQSLGIRIAMTIA